MLGKDELHQGYIGTFRSAVTEFNATAIWVFFHISIARAAGKLPSSAWRLRRTLLWYAQCQFTRTATQLLQHLRIPTCHMSNPKTPAQQLGGASPCCPCSLVVHVSRGPLSTSNLRIRLRSGLPPAPHGALVLYPWSASGHHLWLDANLQTWCTPEPP